MKLVIEINEDCIEALDYELEKIKEDLNKGLTVGQGWSLFQGGR